MKKLLLPLFLLSTACAATSSFDVETYTFKIDRMKIENSPQEYRDMVIKFKTLDGMDIQKATPQPEFYGDQFYSSGIQSFNGLAKNDLFRLDNTFIFKVLDDVNIPYTVFNNVTIFKRNDNTWFAALNNQYFNIEPFVYGTRIVIDCKTVSANGKVIGDYFGNYWKLVNDRNIVIVGDQLVIYNDNVTIINGNTVILEKF
jgi:hypothetical protein